MITYTDVTNLKEVIIASNKVMMQLTPIQAKMNEIFMPFTKLDKTKAYFLANEDGSITVIQFGSQGQPGYVDAIPFPEDPASNEEVKP